MRLERHPVRELARYGIGMLAPTWRTCRHDSQYFRPTISSRKATNDKRQDLGHGHEVQYSKRIGTPNGEARLRLAVRQSRALVRIDAPRSSNAEIMSQPPLQHPAPSWRALRRDQSRLGRHGNVRSQSGLRPRARDRDGRSPTPSSRSSPKGRCSSSHQSGCLLRHGQLEHRDPRALRPDRQGARVDYWTSRRPATC